MSSTRTPVLLDTDIGSDIDDAVCLAYLLRQPACELVGVTTCSGDTVQRALLAALLCEAGGRADVPVHAGLAGPMLNGVQQREAPQYAAVADRCPRRDFHRGAAIDFMRRTIRDRPGEITLLAIGSMTNLATLFTLDPELPGLLREVVLMCGVFTGQCGHGPGAREWNAMMDPIATAIVFNTRPPRLTSVGTDVTIKCRMPADDCRSRFNREDEALRAVADMAEVWFSSRPHLTFHDPLAAATIFEPELCTYATGTVTVEPTHPTLAGLTTFAAGDADAPHRVATDVQADRFFEHYFGTVCR